MPEENFWTLWCKGRLTESDTLTIRTNQCLPPSSPHIFLRAGCLSCRPTNSVEALKAGTWSSAQTISDVFTKVISSLNTSAFSKLGFLMMMMCCINSLTYLLTLLTARLYDAQGVLERRPFFRVDSRRVKSTFLTNVDQNAFKLRDVATQILLQPTTTDCSSQTSHRLTELSFSFPSDTQIGHFTEVLPIQSLNWVLKKVNLIQQHQTYINKPRDTVTQDKH